MSSGDTQLGFMFQQVARRIWSVRELVSAVRTSVEREYTDVWLEGEISNYRPADSGHMYFTLKDGDAQLSVVMFRSQARLLRFKPENGMQIIVRGRVTIYDARGQLQLSAEMLEPRGAGALQVAFEQLKRKLAEEGLFDASRKKAVPLLPRRIGIITSTRGAAIQDMLNVLRRRHESANVLIYPAQVQGESAATEVIAGLRYFNRARQVDVIVIARGGGSLEDLAAFNDEGLARAIAASELPVISAIGHETDFTIADFVADLRAPTPSAAAELVLESRHQLDERIANLHQRLARAARYRLLLAQNRLTELARHGAFGSIRDLVSRRQQRLDDLDFRLRTTQVERLQRLRQRLEVASSRVRHHDFTRAIAARRQDLEARLGRLSAGVARTLMQRRARVEQAFSNLNALSPTRILERGYALVFDAQGQLVKDAASVGPGEQITAQVARGRIIATVKSSQ